MTGTAATRVQQFPAADIVLETDVKPAGDGGYAVPVTADAPGCIGLRWYEMRSLRRLGLHWANGGEPSIDTVQLQYWVGISPWQGGWKPLVAKLERAPGVWNWEIAHRDQPEGTYRVKVGVRGRETADHTHKDRRLQPLGVGHGEFESRIAT